MTEQRIYNFGAGPAMLPEAILRQAKEELLNWHQMGVSILELGHRTPQFIELLEHAEQSLRDLLDIPQSYCVLFLGGAARTQFASIPMNFLNPKGQAGYLITGHWSKMAFQEATLLKKAYCMADEEPGGFKTIPKDRCWEIKKNTAYVYYTPNETVDGVRFPYVPQVDDLPLIADMTSCLLTEPIDVSQYGLIFAGAQKNIANAGLTLVIIREDLLHIIPDPPVPTIMHYQTHATNHSLYATPPVFNCYMADKMFRWIKANGGVQAFFELNQSKAAKLYQFLDENPFYSTQVAPEARSLVNICFSIADPALEPKFIHLAQQKGLYALKGHRLVGGLRASLYNAMPMAGVDALIDFMSEFAKGYCS
jgi:phosphoserine aminotransferase